MEQLPVYPNKESDQVIRFENLENLSFRSREEYNNNNFHGLYEKSGELFFITQEGNEFECSQKWNIQDLSKLSGNNLLHSEGIDWDAEPKDAMEFENQKEANEYILKNGYSEFASVTEA